MTFDGVRWRQIDAGKATGKPQRDGGTIIMSELGDFDGETTANAVAARSLGTLTVREGLRLSEEQGGNRIEAYITPDHRDEIRLRSYVSVPLNQDKGSPEERLFCRIESIKYDHEFATDDATAVHAQRAMDRDSIDERDYKFIASLHPIATLTGDITGTVDSVERRQPDRLPKPDTIVREAVFDAELKRGLKLPGEGLFVGHLAVSGEKVRTAAEPPTVDYRLRDTSATDPLVFRHLLIAGGTGSGKTHAAKNLLRQIVSEERRYEMHGGRQVRPALIIIDPQDEYAQLHDDNQYLDDTYRRKLVREDVAFDGVDETTVFVPDVARTSYEANNHRAEQRAFTIPFSLVRRNPWLIAGGDLKDHQYNALTLLLDRFFNSHGPTGTYQEFRDFLDDPELKADLDTSGRVHEATFDAIKRRVLGFDAVFDQGATPITEQIPSFVRPGGISTIPTYHLEGRRQRMAIVLAISSLIVDEKLTSDPTYPRIGETPIILAMDEAHNYLAESDTVQARRTIGKFTEAAKQGRKERLGLALVTQDPGDIAEPIFKQINTRIALNLADEDVISSLNLPSSLAAQVPDLERGRMVVHSPDNAESVQVVGLDRCVVKHDPR